MKNQLKITVSGVTNSGKSTMARAISDALQILGVDVTLEENDSSITPPVDILQGKSVTIETKAIQHKPIMTVEQIEATRQKILKQDNLGTDGWIGMLFSSREAYEKEARKRAIELLKKEGFAVK